MKAVVMAGGKGTRMASLSTTLPKPMLPLGGKPILAHTVELLAREDFREIFLVVGHQKEEIMRYFGGGHAFGVRISYVVEDTPLGTAGALSLLKKELSGEDFLLLCGDLLCDVNLKSFYAFHKEKGGVVTLLTHPSNHLFDSTAVVRDQNGKVTALLPPTPERGDVPNCTNAGLHFCAPALLDSFGEPKKTDLDREVLSPLSQKGALFAYQSPEYVRDVGTPARLAEAAEDLAKGRLQKWRLTARKPAVFLDRDGTVNQHVGFLTHPDQIKLLPHAAEAIRRLNEQGYPVFLVTNQPVLARGEVTWEGLDAIHRRLHTLLSREGAYLTDIFVCPHHPDSGFAGEVAALKIPCDCRKPAPGLLLRAAARYGIDLSRSVMIGDSECDVLAGKNAGCLTAVIGAHPEADIEGPHLLACVRAFLTREGVEA